MWVSGREDCWVERSHYLYAFEPDFSIPVQVQRGQMPTLVWPERRTRRGVKRSNTLRGESTVQLEGLLSRKIENRKRAGELTLSVAV